MKKEIASTLSSPASIARGSVRYEGRGPWWRLDQGFASDTIHRVTLSRLSARRLLGALPPHNAARCSAGDDRFGLPVGRGWGVKVDSGRTSCCGVGRNARKISNLGMDGGDPPPIFLQTNAPRHPDRLGHGGYSHPIFRGSNGNFAPQKNLQILHFKCINPDGPTTCGGRRVAKYSQLPPVGHSCIV